MKKCQFEALQTFRRRDDLAAHEVVELMDCAKCGGHVEICMIKGAPLLFTKEHMRRLLAELCKNCCEGRGSLPRLIDAVKLLEEIKDWHDSLGGTMNPADWGIQNVLQSVMDSIIEAPTIDAEPVRQARWIDPDNNGEWYCSSCGVIAPDEGYDCNAKYCYECGAKMDAKE